MKKHLILFLLAFEVSSSYSQNQQVLSQQKIDFVFQERIQNHYFQDTLWVKDSIIQYNVIPGSGLMLEGTLRTLSRNDQGNTLTYLYLVNNDNPQVYGTSIFDSTLYFGDQSVKEHFAEYWIPNEQDWLLGTYDAFESPAIRKESIKKWYSNSTQNFTDGSRRLYINSNGHADTLIEQEYIPETDSWKYSLKTYFFYDEFGNDTLLTIYHWKNNQWSDSAMHQQSFESNKLMLHIESVFDSDGFTWQYSKKRNITYTDFAEQEMDHQLLWDTSTNNWIDNYKNMISYDDQNRVINRLFMQYNPFSQQLENYHNSLYHFEEGREVITYQLWDSSLGAWHNYSQYVYSYLKDDLIDTVQGNNWNDVTQQWQGNYRDVSRFDDHLNQIDMTRYNYIGDEWEIGGRHDYFWSPFIPNVIPEIKTNALDVYPNPGSTQVSFVLPEIQSKTSNQIPIKIFDLSGRQIAEIQVNSGKAVWNCAPVKPGLYVYSTILNGQIITGKIVVKNERD